MRLRRTPETSSRARSPSRSGSPAVRAARSIAVASRKKPRSAAEARERASPLATKAHRAADAARELSARDRPLSLALERADLEGRAASAADDERLAGDLGGSRIERGARGRDVEQLDAGGPQ